MTRLYWVLIVCGLALIPSELRAQKTCNDCSEQTMTCMEGHYDTCDLPGTPNGWSGGCVTDCKPWADCSIHEGGCQVTQLLNVQEVSELLGSSDLDALAAAVVEDRVGFDESRGTIYTYSCSTGEILGQVPLANPDLIAAAVVDLQDRLLAEALHDRNP